MVTIIFSLLASTASYAHGTREAIADLFIKENRLIVEIYASWEPYVIGMNLDGLIDTNDSPMVAAYDALRAQPDSALAAQIQENWDDIASKITITGAGPLELDRIEIDTEPDLTLPRDGRVYASAPLAADGSDITFGWAVEYGPVILRTNIGDETYAAFLEGGQTSAPITLTEGVTETAFQTFKRFTVEGYEHIIPKGLDHILFVLGLFFFAFAWRPLLEQVTAFTLAHTVTLGMATVGIINIPDDWMWLVETLIALSIAYVAIENIFRPKLGWWRIVVVFGFGLLHGLGFASVLGDLGLSQGHFILSLVAFNIGVEIGQLTVILGAFLVLALAAFAVRRAKTQESIDVSLHGLHRATSIVGSVMIALIGIYWVWDRIPLG